MHKQTVEKAMTKLVKQTEADANELAHQIGNFMAHHSLITCLMAMAMHSCSIIEFMGSAEAARELSAAFRAAINKASESSMKGSK
jgi:hypothetical protein